MGCRLTSSIRSGGVRSSSREAGPWRPRAPLPRQPAGSPVPTSSPRMLQLPFAKGVRAALPLLKIFEMCQADEKQGPIRRSRSDEEWQGLISVYCHFSNRCSQPGLVEGRHIYMHWLVLYITLSLQLRFREGMTCPRTFSQKM